jgi:hypothetical protein
MINGVASDPFSAITLAPNPKLVTGNMEKIVKVSRERFGNPVSEVEEKIHRWMGSDYHKETAILIGQHSEEELENNAQSALEPVFEQLKEKPEVEPKISTHNPEVFTKPILNQPKPVQANKEALKKPNHQKTNDTSKHWEERKKHKNEQNRNKDKGNQKKENPIWQVAFGLNQANQKPPSHTSPVIPVVREDKEDQTPKQSSKIVLSPGDKHNF